MNGSTLIVLAVFAAGTVLAWRRGARALAVGLGAFAVLPALTLVEQSDPWLLALLTAAFAGIAWLRWSRSEATVTRWGARIRRKAGVASSLDIVRAGSAVAMRRKAPMVRPSLAPTSRWARLVQLVRLPAIAVGVELCRVGALRVWASIEDVVVVFGGPRTGKTQWLAGRVLDAPGAALVTSTRTDLLAQTGPLRAQVGPVLVFNPVGLAGIGSTITFDPLTGCTDPVTAHARAEDMLAAANKAGGGDREFWDGQARRNLAALLHAAALSSTTDRPLSMLDVQRWLADLDGCEAEIVELLAASPEPAFEAAVAQFLRTNERTRTSITSTIAPALGWLTHGPARAAAAPIGRGGQAFDVAALLASKATVYLLGGEEAQVAPLVCALTGHIAREARRIAAHQPGGRLDPPLSLRLDEAALICPVPLDQWTADMGGRGVNIVACFQSRAQLVDRYGQAKAAVILNNSGARMLFGGTADRDDLTYWSTLAGDREEPIVTTDLHGRVASRSTRRVPVLSPAQLANLPARRVVVFRRDMPPAIGRAEQAWRRRDVHTYHHPDALAVRVRAALARHQATAGRWITQHAAPVIGWLRAATRTVGRWVTALRVRVTGQGGPISYRDPVVVEGQVVPVEIGAGAEVIPLRPSGPSQGDDPAGGWSS